MSKKYDFSDFDEPVAPKKSEYDFSDFDEQPAITPVPEESSSTMAAVRGFTNLFGFLPKVAGATEAAGRIVGLEGLGGPLKDISVSEEGPTLYADDLMKAYEERKALEKGAVEKAQQENPVAYTGGLLAQGLALPGPSVATLGKSIATGAGYGALQGIGESDLSKPMESLENIAKYTTTGGVLGGALSKAPAMIKAATKSPITAGAVVGGTIGAGTEALQGGDLSDIAGAGLTGAATGVGVVGAAKGALYLGKEVGSFVNNLPMIKTLKDVAKQAYAGKTFSTQEGQDAARIALREAGDALPESLSKEKERLYNLEQKIINNKAKPQEVYDVVNNILQKAEKETLAETADKTTLQKAIDPFIAKESIADDVIQQASNDVSGKFTELSDRFAESIQKSSNKMKTVVDNLDNQVGYYDVGTDLVKIMDPVKAKTIGEQSQVDLVRRTVGKVLNIDPDNIVEKKALQSLKPSQIREVIISLNRIKSNLTDTAKSFAESTVKKLESTLLSKADDASKSVYQQSSKELATLGSLQDLTDIAPKYALNAPIAQAKDFSTAAKDILKMQNPKSVEGVTFKKVLSEIKDLHPELVDFIEKDLVASLKNHETLSDPANILISKIQVKSPEEILMMKKAIEATEVASASAKKLKQDVLKKLNERLLTGLKEREKQALAKITERQNIIGQASDLSGVKLGPAGELTEPDKIAAMKKITNLAAEDKGLKKVDPSLESSLDLFSKLNKPKAQEIGKNLEEAQVGQRLSKIYAEVPATPIGQVAKAFGTGTMKVVESVAKKFKTANDWVKSASTDNAVINNTINKIQNSELVNSVTGKDLMSKLQVVAKSSGQSRKALMYVLSQRPEYRNIINELMKEDEGE